MKRVLLLAMAVLLVGGLAIAKTVKIPITPADLKDLKGTWTGERITSGEGSLRSDLIFKNDNLPLLGDLTNYYRLDAPKTWPCRGRIEDGRLKLDCWNKTVILDLGLSKKDDGSMELSGTMQGAGLSAPVFLKKEK